MSAVVALPWLHGCSPAVVACFDRRFEVLEANKDIEDVFYDASNLCQFIREARVLDVISHEQADFLSRRLHAAVFDLLCSGDYTSPVHL